MSDDCALSSSPEALAGEDMKDAHIGQKSQCAQGLLGMAPPSSTLEAPVEAPR